MYVLIQIYRKKWAQFNSQQYEKWQIDLYYKDQLKRQSPTLSVLTFSKGHILTWQHILFQKMLQYHYFTIQSKQRYLCLSSVTHPPTE